MSEYDNLVSIYDSWSAADPASRQTAEFYVQLGIMADGEVVELGVGSGRIALDIARLGKSVIGVDISKKMLDECLSRAQLEGLEHLIELVLGDIKSFILKSPASLIIMPFRTIGHLLTREDKIQGLTRIYRQLLPGGRLVFDHYVLNRTWAHNNNGVPRLMCKTFNETKGVNELVWDTYLYNFPDQLMDCTITIEETGLDHTVIQRQHWPLTFSWIEPSQLREIILNIGYDVEVVYGGFDMRPFTEESKEQIWCIRRPISDVS